VDREQAERFSLDNKRALVTGGSKGIGGEIAIELAKAGANVAIVGRDTEGLEATRQAIAATGQECLTIPADLSTVEGPRQAAQSALDHFGTVDILVNNAGIAQNDHLLDISLEEWDRTQAVNVRAPLIIAQTLAPAMIAQGRGKIVNISSQAGVVALERHGSYCSSKGALNMLTKVMALEWGPHNIQSNAVAPTVILTPMGERVWGDPEVGAPMLAKIPLGRFGQPVEVADLVLFLSSAASDLINGAVILIDGGYTAI
jgi:NAD(P)-dependent dehydrogenase (short-subunit alcohol dehydrogenase family)